MKTLIAALAVAGVAMAAPASADVGPGNNWFTYPGCYYRYGGCYLGPGYYNGYWWSGGPWWGRGDYGPHAAMPGCLLPYDSGMCK